MDSEKWMRNFSEQKYIRILVNAKMLGEGLGKNLAELKNHLSEYAFNLLYTSSKEDSMAIKLSDFSVQSSFDFSKNKRVYLFVSYDKLAVSRPEGVKIIKAFVNHTKELVRDYYQEAAKRKSA
jgi:hypothetical protein